MPRIGEKFAFDLTWQEKLGVESVASRTSWEYEHEKKGDHYNTDCPWCGKNNTYVTDGIKVTSHLSRVFERSCQNCGKPIIFKAEMVISIKAVRKGDKGYVNDLFERLSKKQFVPEPADLP
ncbi:MAG: hypothetical protein HYT63_00185 [Candidatus Yanofskybacteria bacterium]|nr:hypothetical protein [Candidatus Yanofskybacteria bacterium]